jgi:hypothetical protein
MSLGPPSQRLPWQLRLAALVAAFVVSLSLVVFWIAGVRFVRLVADVSQQLAQSEASSTAPKQEPTEKPDPGVVSVRVLPPDEDKTRDSDQRAD